MITSIKAPRINPNDDEVGVLEWHVDDGGYIEVGDELVDLETSKAAVTVEAEVAGYVRRLAEKGDIVSVGAPICRVGDSLQALDSKGTVDSVETVHSEEVVGFAGKPTARAPVAPRRTASDTMERHISEAGNAAPAAARRYATTRLSSAARALMQDMGLEPEHFAGAGLVTARALRSRREEPLPPAARTGRLSLAKRAEIQSLSMGESGALNSTLSVYFDSAEIRARLERDELFDGSVQPLLLYEISRLLRLWPQFTAYFAADSLHFHDRVDLGLAIDLGDGVKVMTIKDADTLTPQQIFERTIDFGLRYIEKRIRPDELVGSTCTVTDLSSLDILHFKPLVNGRQSAIIGIGGDRVQPGSPISVNMTFDHRVASGREAGSFLKELRARMLTYAAEGAPGGGVPRTAGSDPSSPHPLDLPVCCDTCGMGYEAYSREFGAQAHMLAHFRQDGSLGRVCHRCFDGWA
jgi:pyruvate/2-oxoglutarate dehydrogenase complex dihydrolipoamide acyltransferase (E2) component